MANHPSQMRWRRELELLSRTGVGLPAIAPALAILIRKIVGGQTCVIMWVDPNGMPTGVHHEHPNEATQALFMNEYERLFNGNHETNVSWLVRQRGQTCGLLLNPPAAYFRSNTYNLLVRADHYKHMLDLRIDVEGVTQAVVALLRPPGKAFGETDAMIFNGLLPALQRACTKVANALGEHPLGSGVGHLLVSSDGHLVHMANAEGVALVRRSRLVGQHIELQGAMETVPLFVRDLCLRLNSAVQSSVQCSVDVPGGVLQCTASWMATQAAEIPQGPRQILVTLQCQQAQAAQVVSQISGLALSPLQSRIALYAAAGGRRDACAAEHQISDEALKKHLRRIYAASGAQEWSELQTRLHTAALTGA